MLPATIVKHADKIRDFWKPEDTGGYSIDLKPGWSTPDGLHIIEESTLREVARVLAGIESCNCDQCREAA